MRRSNGDCCARAIFKRIDGHGRIAGSPLVLICCSLRADHNYLETCLVLNLRHPFYVHLFVSHFTDLLFNFKSSFLVCICFLSSFMSHPFCFLLSPSHSLFYSVFHFPFTLFLLSIFHFLSLSFIFLCFSVLSSLSLFLSFCLSLPITDQPTWCHLLKLL